MNTGGDYPAATIGRGFAGEPTGHTKPGLEEDLFTQAEAKRVNAKQ